MSCRGLLKSMEKKQRNTNHLGQPTPKCWWTNNSAFVCVCLFDDQYEPAQTRFETESSLQNWTRVTLQHSPVPICYRVPDTPVSEFFNFGHFAPDCTGLPQQIYTTAWKTKILNSIQEKSQYQTWKMTKRKRQANLKLTTEMTNNLKPKLGNENTKTQA